MASLESILATYGPALARVAAAYEANHALREELLQDILVAIHLALPDLRDETRLAPFVFRIAHNRGVTHAVREKRARLLPPAHDVAPATPTPEDHLILDEQTRRLQAAVRILSIPHRQVITLALEGLSHAEIAQTLGLTVGNVAVRINRAKAKLLEFMNERA